MKLKALVAGMALVAMTQGVMAAEPTRSFLLEKGTTAGSGNGSVDALVHSNQNLIGARLGVGDGELIISNSAISGRAEEGTAAVFKLALKEVKGLAVYGGISTYDNDNSDYLNLKAGAAFTTQVEKLELTANGELVIDDITDKNYFNFGAGAFMDLGKSAYGTFKPGAEVVISTLSGRDTALALGVRWEYNNRLTVDAIPVYLSNNDTVALPGTVRINLAF